MQLEEAYAVLGRGRCLAALGDPAADRPLREARHLFDEMGARARVTECDTLIAQAGRLSSHIRERLEALGEELSVALSFRTGVNTGEVVAGEGETLVTGDAVNVAARLEQAAAPGEILIGA